jgi:hypothetical protein
VACLAFLGGITPAVAQPTLDSYGGTVAGVAPATGYYEVKQVGNRWMFVTPAGNGMWMTGIYAVIYPVSVDDLGTNTESRIAAKYGGGSDWKHKWRVNAARRLKQWGFNTLAEYHHWGMRPGLADPNPEQMPYIHIMKPSWYGLDNRYGLGTGPFKDLIVGTDPRYFDYRGATTPDVFDPNFETFVDGWVRGDDGLKYGNIGNPWMMGIAVDDMDQLFGFGPGREVPAARLHPHLGWMALVTRFEQTSSPWVSWYADRKVYTKYALRDFLASRYGTIAALNTAWGSNYTTFDSAGGWGVGSGLLDENGRNPWVGRWSDEMATGSAVLRNDLNEFLYLHAKRYFSVVAAKVRKYAPQHLVFGPASFNFWGGLTRKEVLRAAGEHLDVLQCAIGSQQVLELTARYAGNKPIVTWDAFVSNPDSALWRHPNLPDIPGGIRAVTSQEERGQIYADNVEFAFNGVTSAGIHPVAGIKLWSWTDNWWEKANFGVVTFSDNAYDGREATVAGGRDSAGWPTGGEESNYGDFLTAVTAAHRTVASSLGGGPVPPDPSYVALAVENPIDGAIVPRNLPVSGWAFDVGATTGPGVDLIRVFAGSTCAGTVLGDALMGAIRPDVQAVHGLGPTFLGTGFVGTVRMPRGPSQMTICARSTVTGTFGAQKTLTVTAKSRRARALLGLP